MQKGVKNFLLILVIFTISISLVAGFSLSDWWNGLTGRVVDSGNQTSGGGSSGSGGGGGVSSLNYQQYPDGLVSLEAENYTGSYFPSSITWSIISGSYASGRAIQSLPNKGITITSNIETTSPMVSYSINFVKNGTYYVWIRGVAGSGSDDSLHVGLDGVVQSTSDRITGFGTSLGWSRSTMDSVVATIDVTSIGIHTLNVWMREDGMVIDKIVLAVNSSYVPSKEGPQLSVSGGSATACSYTYSEWSSCVDGTQTRTAVASPAGCIGKPVISQTCSLASTCTDSDGGVSYYVQGSISGNNLFQESSGEDADTIVLSSTKVQLYINNNWINVALGNTYDFGFGLANITSITFYALKDSRNKVIVSYSKLTDYCDGSTTLNEAVCAAFPDSKSGYDRTSCVNGCFDGKCYYGLGESIKLQEGDTIGVEGPNFGYKVVINFISATSAKLTLNNFTTPAISIGESYNLSDGNIVEIADVFYSTKESVKSVVVFSISKAGSIQQICSDLINKVANPDNEMERYNINYTLNWNSSYVGDWYTNGQSKRYTAYNAAWGGYHTESMTYNYFSFNVMVFDDENIDSTQILSEMLGSSICQIRDYWDSSNVQNRVYVCNWDVLRDSQNSDNSQYQSRQIFWNNGNVIVELQTYVVGQQLTDEELNKVMSQRVNDFVSSLKNNEFKYPDWKDFTIDYPLSNELYESLSICNSNLDLPVYQGTNETCYPNIACKIEPAVCPEYGYQNRICINSCTQQPTEERVYCSPGICSGCYAPRWFGYNNGDNICIPYGIRLTQTQTSTDTDDLPEGYYSEGQFSWNLTVVSDTMATFVITNGNVSLEYELSEGKETTLDFRSIGISEQPLTLIVVNVNPGIGTERGTIEFKIKESFNAYCDIDGQLKRQRNWEGAECQNNYECSSNLCSDGQCVPVNALIKEAKGLKGLVVRVLCRMANIFDSENYDICIQNYS